MREVVFALAEALQSGEPAALATVVQTSGSAPQSPGARLLLFANGRQVGTVGGGAIEWVTLEALRQCLEDGRPTLLRRDLAADLAMCCGGRMTLFVERIQEAPRLILCGAGHVAQAVAELARKLDFQVLVLDEREELNSEARFPGCERYLRDPTEGPALLTPTHQDWVLITTHDHRLDEDSLAAFGACPHRYLGLIGSRRKVYRILRRLHARGSLPPMDRVYSPVGLALGAVTPSEIAVSIVAELVALRRGRPEGPHLRIMDEPSLQKVLSGESDPPPS